MMIPISLKVTLDLVKLFYALLVKWDAKMYDPEFDTPASAPNTAIGEDLGQVHPPVLWAYIFDTNIDIYTRCSGPS